MRLRTIEAFLIFAALCLLSAAFAHAGWIDPVLGEKLDRAAPGEKVRGIVLMAERVDLDDLTAKLDGEGAGFGDDQEVHTGFFRVGVVVGGAVDLYRDTVGSE